MLRPKSLICVFIIISILFTGCESADGINSLESAKAKAKPVMEISNAPVGKDGRDKEDKEKDSTEKTQDEEQPRIETGELSIVTGKHYDSFYISMNPEEFKELGFELGDGVDVVLSNGETYYNIPFYSGDYCRLFEYYIFEDVYEDTIDICCNYLPGFYIEENITDDTTVNIVLHEKGKYKDIEKHLNLSYSNDPADYPNEEVFANFRSLSGGKIARGKFYRGASPCNNNTNRSMYVNKLMRERNIAYVLDLADSRKTFEKYRKIYGEEYTYDWDLFLNSKVYFVEMDFDYTNVDYKTWIADGLKDMIKNDGPYFIHCNEGMDRTGFVCAILEGLAGATYEEMRDDYMVTYKNYYGIDDETDPTTYDLIVEIYFDSFMMLLHGTDDHKTLKKNNYEKDIERYLREGGMTKKEIKKLKKILKKEIQEEVNYE